VLSPIENDALKGIIPRFPTFPWEVRGVSMFDFFRNLDFFPTDFRGGFPDTPVLAPPVFESTGGPAISVEPPDPPPISPVSIFSDIVSVFTGPSDVNTGGIFDLIIGGASEIFRRQTTTAEERVASGTFFEGDIARTIGNIGIGAFESIFDRGPFLQGFEGLKTTGVTPVTGILEGLTGGSVSVAPCPSPGGSQGFPAGSCITINDWQQLGAPKGFEVAGVSSGGTLILRKKRRRRRRGGLTKGMMTDVDYLARKLGKPAAETYLNRVL